MSYYFCIVGTRDNPLYESELASKPSAPSGAASFFSSASSSTVPPSSAFAPAPSETSSSGSGDAGGLFGFGSTTTAPTGKGLGFGRYRDKAVLQMIAHSAIDVVEDVSVTNGSMYLKGVDRINEWSTSAFALPGNVKFLILHEHKHDDGIRNFFLDIWEAYLKVMMNPFHDPNTPITSPSFDAKVKASARKHL